MAAEVVVIYLFDDLIYAPEFTVEEYETFACCLSSHIAVRNEVLVHRVTEECGTVVVSAVSESDAVEFLDRLAVFLLGSLAVEEVVVHTVLAVLVA